MHLYIWLLVVGIQPGGLVLLYSDGWTGGGRGGENKHRNSNDQNMTPLLLPPSVLTDPCCFSPSEDECWPGDQGRRPYLAPAEDTSATASQKISAPPEKPPKYQPVVNSNYSTGGTGMVSRRAIISRSRDDLQHHLGVNNKNFTGEDQWFSKEKLYKVCYVGHWADDSLGPLDGILTISSK